MIRSGVLLLLLLCGCGGDPGPGAFVGSVENIPVASAILWSRDLRNELNVFLSGASAKTVCATRQPLWFPSLTLSIVDSGQVRARTYELTPRALFQAEPGRDGAYVLYDTSAGVKRPSGSIVIEQLELGAHPAARGRFELQFENGKASGWFDATPCPER